MLPNVDVIAPSDETELSRALEFAVKNDRATAIRYPREPVMAVGHEGAPFERGKCRRLRSADDSKVAVVACGVMAARAMKAAAILEKEGIEVDVIDARFAKPIDQSIVALCRQKIVVTVEDSSLTGGFGSAVLEEAHRAAPGVGNVRVVTLGGPDRFVRHAGRDRQLGESGIDAAGIAAAVRQALA
jgi:1-deoxy-D-xylulose-5-phosphate synthase